MWNVGHQHYLSLGEYVALSDGLVDKFLFGLIKVLPLIVISYGVGLGVEFIFCIIKGHAIQEGFLVSGLLIPLIVPVDIPWWMLIVAIIFAVVIGKEVFGGTGMNILNVALTARAFLFFAYPTKMSGDKVWTNLDTAEGQKVIDGFSGATPLGDLGGTVTLTKEMNVAELAGKADEVSEIQNQIDLAVAKVPTLWDAFAGWVPGSIGETSGIACLIGAAILLATGIASWRVMVSFFAGGFVMAYIFNAFAVNPFMEIDPMLQLSLGGFMFGLVFMATDPVTAAQTNTGKWIYGFLWRFLCYYD